MLMGIITGCGMSEEDAKEYVTKNKNNIKSIFWI